MASSWLVPSSGNTETKKKIKKKKHKTKNNHKYVLNDLSKRRRGIWNFLFSSRLGTWMVYYEYIEQVSTGLPAAERRVKR